MISASALFQVLFCAGSPLAIALPQRQFQTQFQVWWFIEIFSAQIFFIARTMTTPLNSLRSSARLGRQAEAVAAALVEDSRRRGSRPRLPWLFWSRSTSECSASAFTRQIRVWTMCNSKLHDVCRADVFAYILPNHYDPITQRWYLNNFRLNDDGSYTYGYEASDGTFKLETRFADGTVQGKYGYIDANGEVKIIEYGADVMGFQPEGDLPEGIVIPPPVQGTCHEACDILIMLILFQVTALTVIMITTILSWVLRRKRGDKLLTEPEPAAVTRHVEEPEAVISHVTSHVTSPDQLLGDLRLSLNNNSNSNNNNNLSQLHPLLHLNPLLFHQDLLHWSLRKYSHEYISTQSMRPPTHEYLFWSTDHFF